MAGTKFDILLRERINALLTTKGSKLNNLEIDDNFLAIFVALCSIDNGVLLDPYDNGRTYKGGVTVFAGFDSASWKFISDDDQQGIAPGSNDLVWSLVSISEFAHERDRDTFLAIGTVDEISAANAVDFIDRNVESLTRAELLAKIAAESLKAGKTYFLNDRDVFLKSLSSTEVSLEGHLLARNPDFQNLKENNLGVWTPSIDDGSPGLQANDVAIYNGKQWKSLTGEIGGSPALSPDLDPTNWEELPNTDASWINEIDSIEYDLTNDVLISREDKRGNRVFTEADQVNAVSPPRNPIDQFQWGNDEVKGNLIHQNSELDSLNNLQQIEYVQLVDSTTIANMQTNAFKRTQIFGEVNDFSASLVDIEDQFRVSGIVVDPIVTDTITPKTAGAGVSVDGVLLKNGLVQIEEGIVGLTDVNSGVLVDQILDEDAFGSDSDTALATQQSIKAFVLANVGAVAGANTEIQFNKAGVFGSNALYVFDDANVRLGVRIAIPTATAHFKGAGATSATFAGKYDNSVGTKILHLRDDGNAQFGGFITFSDISNPTSSDMSIFQIAGTGIIRGKSGALQLSIRSNDNSKDYLQFTTNNITVVNAPIEFNTSSLSGISSTTGKIFGSGILILKGGSTGLRMRSSDNVTEIFILDDATENVSIGTGANGVEKLQIGGNIRISGVYKVGANQVLGARVGGWAVPTGTMTRTDFTPATILLPALAEQVNALKNDFHAAGHGSIGV